MLEVVHIQKKRGKKQVLNDISFRVNCGECVAIVGRNGCGKSTLLQIMAGVLKPDQGEIRYFGKDARKDRKVVREYCGYVPQENPLMEELTVKDNLRLWAGTSREIERNVIEQFQLDELMKEQVSKLSGGMKRRLGIACAMLRWPPILLMDEPTTALDIYYNDRVWQWIQQYREKNGMVVMTTHDEREIMGADRCLIMQDGVLTELEKNEITMENIRQMIDRLNEKGGNR